MRSALRLVEAIKKGATPENAAKHRVRQGQAEEKARLLATGCHCRTKGHSMTAVAYAEPVCLSCLRQMGLCEAHKRDVLPQLAQPFWYRHAHSGKWTDEKETAAKRAKALPESPEAEAHAKRKQTARMIAKAKRANKSKRGYLGLYLAIQKRPRLLGIGGGHF